MASPPVTRAWRVVHRVLDKLLRETYGHPASVQALAVASLALLLSAALYFLSPLLEDDYHLYARFLPWVELLDWRHYDSFVVDHAVVFVGISLPVVWLLLVHVAYSSIASPVEVALLVLRVASCLTVSFSLTVILTEFLSRRAMLALVSLAYGSLGLLYSWSVPAWRWYVTEARRKGLVAFLPASMQQLLLRTSLLEWLTDTSFSDRMRPFLPFLLPLSKVEQTRLLEQMPAETQITMTRPGLLPLLPSSVQRALLPAESDSDGDSDSDSSALILVGSHDGSGSTETVSQSDDDSAQESSSLSAGFDFHRPEVRQNVVAPPTPPEQIVGEIITSRIWSGCRQLVTMPSSTTLNRTASVSSALLVMQLYASRGSRRAFLTFMQFLATSALGSVACCAILLRVLQVMDIKFSGHSAPLLRYVHQYLIRSQIPATAQISASAAAGPPVTLRKAATSASAVVAVLFVLRKLRR